MSRSIQVAVIQMEGATAPTSARLKRADMLIQSAVEQGAELVVLPSYFNTGKTFSETNYEVTERLSDETMQWMCRQAEQHNIHVIGAWMIVDGDDTYLAATLVAPDGETWRYDQQFPYAWERVFYRDGHGIVVADTSLGKMGIMIGWDAAHPDLWERYAAKVDLMLIMNSELDLEQATLRYTDGSETHIHKFGFFASWLARATNNYLHYDVEAQGNWMTVPTVCVGMSGEFESILPAPFLSIHVLLFGRTSALQKAQEQYHEMMLITPFERNTRVLDGSGDTLGRIMADGDLVAVVEVELTDKTPLPLDEPQPEMSVSELARFTVDLLSGAFLTLNYRRGVRRQWGARMAPIDDSTRVWVRVLIVVAALAAFIGRLSQSRRR